MISKYNTFVILTTIVAMILVIQYYPRKSDVSTIPTETPTTNLQAEPTGTIAESETRVTSSTKTIPEPLVETLPVFTKASLTKFDGEDVSLPIYVAFEGSVYDVTEGKKFYGPDGHYHFLAGTDGTKLLKVFGGSTIQEKYPVVGTFVK